MTESNCVPALVTDDYAELLVALKAALAYMTNAAIDLQKGVRKSTALVTLNGGMAVVRAAIAKAEGK